jgi:hypothetical protein
LETALNGTRKRCARSADLNHWRMRSRLRVAVCNRWAKNATVGIDRATADWCLMTRGQPLRIPTAPSGTLHIVATGPCTPRRTVGIERGVATTAAWAQRIGALQGFSCRGMRRVRLTSGRMRRSPARVVTRTSRRRMEPHSWVATASTAAYALGTSLGARPRRSPVAPFRTTLSPWQFAGTSGIPELCGGQRVAG